MTQNEAITGGLPGESFGVPITGRVKDGGEVFGLVVDRSMNQFPPPSHGWTYAETGPEMVIKLI
jgi:hypothetical protein